MKVSDVFSYPATFWFLLLSLYSRLLLNLTFSPFFLFPLAHFSAFYHQRYTVLPLYTRRVVCPTWCPF